jgi:lysozyme
VRLSERGLQLLRAHEGLRLAAYKPVPTDPWTIGFGSTRYADGRPVQEGDEVTPGQAEELLRVTVRAYEDAVNAAVTVPLTQSQFDALVSWTYNVGTAAMRGSTLIRALNAGDYQKAANELLRWNMAGGVVLEGLRRRREQERALFLSEQQPSQSRSGAPALQETAPNLSRETPAPIEQRTFPPAPPPDARPNDAFRGLDVSYPGLSPNAKPASPAMAPVLAALLPSLVALIPEIGKLLGSGSDVSKRNVAVAEKVAEVVVQATQAPNLQGAIEQMERDPDARSAARIAVQTVWYELSESGGGGIEGARAFAVRAMEGDDWRSIGYGAILGTLAVSIILGGGALVWTLLHNPETTAEQRGMLIGAVVAIMGSVVSFFFGSSVSSRTKDNAIVRELGSR